MFPVVKVPDVHQRRRNEIREQKKIVSLFLIRLNEADEGRGGRTSNSTLHKLIVQIRKDERKVRLFTKNKREPLQWRMPARSCERSPEGENIILAVWLHLLMLLLLFSDGC